MNPSIAARLAGLVAPSSAGRAGAPTVETRPGPTPATKARLACEVAAADLKTRLAQTGIGLANNAGDDFAPIGGSAWLWRAPTRRLHSGRGALIDFAAGPDGRVRARIVVDRVATETDVATDAANEDWFAGRILDALELAQTPDPRRVSRDVGKAGRRPGATA